MRYRMKKEVKSVLAFAMAVLLSLSPLGGMRWSMEKAHALDAALDYYDENSLCIYGNEDDRTSQSNKIEGIDSLDGDTPYYITIGIKTEYQAVLGTTPVNMTRTGAQIKAHDYGTLSTNTDVTLMIESTTATVTGVTMGEDPLGGNQTNGYTIPSGHNLDDSNITITFTANPYYDFTNSGATATTEFVDDNKVWKYSTTDIAAVGNSTVALNGVAGDTFTVTMTNIATVTPSNESYIFTANSKFYKPLSGDTYNLTIMY